MAWINYSNEKYFLKHWRNQCLKCDSVLETWDCVCSCGLVIIKNGQRTWPFFPTRDVSVWKSDSGNVLPQFVLDHYFLSREANKTSANTKASASTG